MANPFAEPAARFEAYKRQINRKTQEATVLKAQAQAREAEMALQARRIDAGLPLKDACPDCWVQRGETHTFIARAASDPTKFDRWGCPKCGWHFDVPVK